ncbi:MAG: T9SS type A sorting domain-containing protein [Sphingobacteriales bacterium]|nr:T9SS type A sorting domain-containing protein [Sphingobacteriales bacterium]
MDSRLMYQSSNPPAIRNGDTLSWNFNNLNANDFRKISIVATTSIPPVLNIHDTLTLVAWVFSEGTRRDTMSLDNYAMLKDVVVGSFEPNYKYSTSRTTLTPTEVDNGEYLTYVVRFQNIGNDTAFKVVILDTLDTNMDWNTFEMVNASHSFSVQLLNGNILKFSSNNIQLPPASINEEGSHGFVAYKVKPKQGLGLGVTVNNTAHIYFDFNIPISTNKVSTYVLLLSKAGNNSFYKGGCRMYPNPNSGIFNVEFVADYKSPLTISLYDLNGRAVYEQKQEHQFISSIPVLLDGLAAGLYNMVLKTEYETVSEKLIVE